MKAFLYHDNIIFDEYKEQDQPNAELELFFFLHCVQIKTKLNQ